MHITRLSIGACLVADYKEAHVRGEARDVVSNVAGGIALIPFFIGIFEARHGNRDARGVLVIGGN